MGLFDISSITTWLAILAVITTFALGFIVWSGQRKDGLRRSFLLLSLFIGLWIFSNIIFAITNDAQRYPIALLSYTFAMGVAIHSFIFFLHLALGNRLSFWTQVKVCFVGYAAGIVSAIPGIVASSVVDGQIKTDPIALLVYGLIFGAYTIAAVVTLFISRWRNAYVNKVQVDIIFVGTIITSVTGVLFNLILPMMNNYRFVQLGPAGAVAFVISIAYVVTKHGLFDVRLAVVRSATYSLVLMTLAGIYMAITFTISSIFSLGESSLSQTVSGVLISLILVFLFQPIRRFFDKITNKIFYKDNYNSDEFFARLNKTLALTTDLRGLLQRAATEIGKTLKSSQAFFFIDTKDGHHVSSGTKDHSQLSKTEADQLAEKASKTKDGVVVAMLLEDSDPIKEMMTNQKIEIALPLVQDGNMIGCLCLGENLSSNYTNRDIRVLSTISNELIIAIQNALSVQEIRDFNVTLKREIANATQELRVKNALLKKLDKAKDEFVSMASHQLRTPLTSVKGYLSMVIEGDAGKVSKNQKDLLDQAFSSNEKMVHLVNDFLNVSRIQTGKFMLEITPVDLVKVVTEEIDGLRQNAKARNLNLVFNPPKNLPILNIDEGKIRQVVMNFADNALYYSNPGTDINITLSVDGDDVLYTVKDTGIGVPVSEQAQLFTKFYRASNARKQRPDGTGVGLYLAKKIITALDGKIVFSTIEGKGSTFGFRLPIKELKSTEKVEDLKD